MTMVAERVLAPGQAETLATAFELLVNPTRLRMLHALACAEELCVRDLYLLLGLEQSTVSHHLRSLRDRGIVSRRKRGRLAWYRLEDPALRGFLGAFDGRAGDGSSADRSSPWAAGRPAAVTESPAARDA